ncbi:MAG: ABC transporter ATP-binding protein [Alphaproteobacteria bacterium GM202ARS2]|nr:ABC transporter ATP-binding protein [Alphaproteobacteria bacterium GM202ARS2]
MPPLKMSDSPNTKGLTVRHISHSYGGEAKRPVLDAISFHVADGAIACLLGPSGCGKSTLLRMIAGLAMPQQGQVMIDGRKVTDAGQKHFIAPEDRHVGMMFQDYALFPHLNVYDNIAFGIDERMDKTWMHQAIRRLGLHAHVGAFPHTLSGGQQQRVALLRALARSPRVLLLDEPFSGLDADNRIRVREETIELLRERSMAVLMVTHDPEEAMFMADSILVMKQGQIIQSGSPTETWLGPANAFVTELFGPVNRFCAKVCEGVVDTPLGRFAAPPSINEGTEVDLLVRPDGIGIAESTQEDFAGVHGTVVAARLLGRVSHIKVDIGNDQLLHVRIAGVILPKIGTKVAVLVERCSAFIFPCQDKQACVSDRAETYQEGAASSKAMPFSLRKERNSPL